MSKEVQALLIVNELDHPVFYKFSNKIKANKVLEVEFQMHAALDSFESVSLETLVSPDLHIYGMATPFKHKIIVYTQNPLPEREADSLLRYMCQQWYKVVMCPFWNEEKSEFIEELGTAYIYEFMLE